MGKNLKSFDEFNNDVNESLAAGLVAKALQQASAVRSQTSATQTSSPDYSTTPTSSSDLFDIKNMTGLDLLLATKVGKSLEDYLLASTGEMKPSDSPEPAEEIISRIRSNRKLRNEVDSNVEEIRSIEGNKKAVIEPDASLLPSSKPYSFKNKDNITWDSLKKALTDAIQWRKIDKSKYTLVALRNYLRVKKNSSNHFVDLIILMSPEKDKKVWPYPATTVPGPMFMVQPFRNWYLSTGLKKTINPKGVAIVQPGVYDYKIGTHKGYTAFVQDGNVEVDRYQPVEVPNRANFNTFSPGNTQRGHFGINVHRSSSRGTSLNVNTWSAGCLVFANGNDFKNVVNKVKNSRQRQIKVALLQMDDIGSSFS